MLINCYLNLKIILLIKSKKINKANPKAKYVQRINNPQGSQVLT